ncbi:hypothetical protein EPUL_000752, partial [Erysiphe pulchra]
MQSLIHRHDSLRIPIGERRKISDLGRFSLDLSWSKDISNSSHSRAYPSPPMSGSPSLPPRLNLDSSDRGHGSHGSGGGLSIYRGLPIPQQEHIEHRGLSNRTFSSFTEPVTFIGQYRSDHISPINVLSNPLQSLPQTSQQQQQHSQSHLEFSSYPSQAIHSLRQPIYPPQNRLSVHEQSCFPSPKQQRKTKGHVASACVPSQRPCSRCVSNGKKEACVDVQHKKRGRPRLRDERETRYDSLASNYSPADLIRRPLSLHSPIDHLNAPYPSSIPQRQVPMLQNPRLSSNSEPACAYLSLDMVVLKATKSFGETIGLQTIINRNFQDIISHNDREKIYRLQQSFEDERREREPNYLPPIYMAKFEEARVIQTIGFGPEDLGQVRTDRQEMITFQAPDGQQRTFQARLGMAKRLSIYFIVVLLYIPKTSQLSYQQPLSPYTRESQSNESQYGIHCSLQPYSQNQSSFPFPAGPSYGDVRLDLNGYRTPSVVGSSLSFSSSGMMPYTQPQVRSDYSQLHSSYQVPRSELLQGIQSRSSDLQLPPIRDPHSQRDYGKNRLHIGGLLDDPDSEKS